MTRRDIREHIIRLLYLRDFHDNSELKEQDELYRMTYIKGNDLPDVPVMVTDDLTLAYDSSFDTDMTGEEKELFDKYEALIDKLGEIDTILGRETSGWKLNRIGKMDLNILRVATYEILFDDTIPAKVAINEAVDLAKLYGSDDSSYGFVNGILAKLVKPEDKA